MRKLIDFLKGFGFGLLIVAVIAGVVVGFVFLATYLTTVGLTQPQAAIAAGAFVMACVFGIFNATL